MTNNDKNSLGYAQDLSPKEAWQMLSDTPHAVLIDVRTAQEWTQIGTPNLDALDRGLYFVPWALPPNMDLNPDFMSQVKEQAKPDSDTPLLFLCRSGVRSVHAAKAFTTAGFTACYNILGGFEGDPDETGNRATLNGWQVDGLSWHKK